MLEMVHADVDLMTLGLNMQAETIQQVLFDDDIAQTIDIDSERAHCPNSMNVEWSADDKPEPCFCVLCLEKLLHLSLGPSEANLKVSASDPQMNTPGRNRAVESLFIALSIRREEQAHSKSCTGEELALWKEGSTAHLKAFFKEVPKAAEWFKGNSTSHGGEFPDWMSCALEPSTTEIAEGLYTAVKKLADQHKLLRDLKAINNKSADTLRYTLADTVQNLHQRFVHNAPYVNQKFIWRCVSQMMYLNAAVVLGLNAAVVLGLNAAVVLGLNAAVVLGLNAAVVLGLNAAVV